MDKSEIIALFKQYKETRESWAALMHKKTQLLVAMSDIGSRLVQSNAVPEQGAVMIDGEIFYFHLNIEEGGNLLEFANISCISKGDVFSMVHAPSTD